MTINIPSKLFISGTGTDVGKTLVSAILMVGLKASYWKPIQCGNYPTTDTQWILEHSQLSKKHVIDEKYIFKTPVSPNQAAEKENITIEITDFSLPKTTQSHLIIEGAGGLLVPINKQDYVVNLISHFKIPTLLVASSGLGTLNHTLLSVAYLESIHIPIWAIVLNGIHHKNNLKDIKARCNVPIFSVPHLTDINPKTLHKTFNDVFISSNL